MSDHVYIRTLPYLVMRALAFVNKLLGSHVLTVVMRNREMMLRDDPVAGARFMFETCAIAKLDSAAHGFDESQILQLIDGLRDGGAARSEQVRE